MNIKKIIGISAVLLLAAMAMAGAGAADISLLPENTTIQIMDDTGTVQEKTVADLGLQGKAYGIYDANDLYELATSQEWSNHGYSLVLMEDIDCSSVTDDFPTIGKYQSRIVILVANGDGTLYDVNPDGSLYRKPFTWIKNGTNYTVTYENGTSENITYDSSDDTINYPDGTVLKKSV